MHEVYEFLIQKRITTSRHSLTGSYISSMYLHLPNKAEALQFLDHSGAHPGRYARVHVTRGNANPPGVMEYKVGPVGGAADSIISALSLCYKMAKYRTIADRLIR
jgi:hypothetical protein